MSDTANETAPSASRVVLIHRLVVAVVQAMVLYFLTRAADAPAAWPATVPVLFDPLILVAGFVPLLALLGLGQIRLRPLAIWLGVVAAIVALLGWYDGWRERLPDWATQDAEWPSERVGVALAAALFVAHALLVDAVIERRLLPSYQRHFETAWKQGCQAALSVAFVGVLWGVLWLGAGLFDIVGIKIFEQIIEKRWFAIPATTLGLAVAVHVTDVQPALIRGTRTLVLSLFSWLLPLLAVILLAFLASLPFISLTPLWETHEAAALLLFAGGLLVLLLNCAYQESGTGRPWVQRIAGTVAAFELAPLLVLAAWGLGQRVGQYGWTTDRIIVAAALVLEACYAIGYAAAALRSPSWMRRLEPANVVAAYVFLVLIVALFTPLADPARLMVASQVAHLKSGAIPAEKFDVVALRTEGARWGAAALQALDADPAIDAAMRTRVHAALAMNARYDPSADARVAVAAGLADRVVVYPEGRTLPPEFLDPSSDPFAGKELQCLTPSATKCLVRFVALNPTEPEAIIFLDSFAGYLLTRDADGHWHETARLSEDYVCNGLRKAVESGSFSLSPHALPDVVVGGRSFVFKPDSDKGCQP
jgi:hypothetical protein